MGLPLSAGTTPAHGDERAPGLPRLDTRRVRTGKRGRPRQRRTGLAAEKGDAANDLRRRLRTRGIRPQMPTRGWPNRQPRGRPINPEVPRDQAERALAWVQRQDRRVVVRWARRAACFHAFLAMAMRHLWVHRLIVG